MIMDPKDFTRVVHSGVSPEPVTGAVMTPIFQTSTFLQQSPGVHQGFDYSRGDNPTRRALETALAALEGASFGLAFSSGLAAEQAILQALDAPCEVVVCDDVYGGTGRLFRRLFAKYGFTFSFVDMTDPLALSRTLSRPVGMVWIESPTNPTLKLIDIAAVAERAKACGAIVVVDNTFASPMLQKPLELGADIVVHSTTKYIGGHSDLIGGALMTSRSDLYDALKFVQFAAGAVPSPFESFLLLRSIKTLAVRMERHCSNAQAIAECLESHPRVHQVIYPGLRSHPQHLLARAQMKGFSGIVSVYLKGDYTDVTRFLGKLSLFTLAESLGGVESLVNHPARMTHASVSPQDRETLGISDTLLRFSVGIESHLDLMHDLKVALA